VIADFAKNSAADRLYQWQVTTSGHHPAIGDADFI
jgi:hypothetical protein